MGVLFFFSENVKGAMYKNELSVEVCDNHSYPEIRIGPKDEASNGQIASFSDWKQFENFVEAVNKLHWRLEGINSQEKKG